MFSFKPSAASSLKTFTCTTSGTSCTAGIGGSTVRIVYCIRVTAHGGSLNISSEPRCQPGRKEGEAIILLPLTSSLFSLTFALHVFLSDFASSDFEESEPGSWFTRVSGCSLATRLVRFSCVWLRNRGQTTEFPNRTDCTGTCELLPDVHKRILSTRQWRNTFVLLHYFSVAGTAICSGQKCDSGR